MFERNSSLLLKLVKHRNARKIWNSHYGVTKAEFKCQTLGQIFAPVLACSFRETLVQKFACPLYRELLSNPIGIRLNTSIIYCINFPIKIEGSSPFWSRDFRLLKLRFPDSRDSRASSRIQEKFDRNWKSREVIRFPSIRRDSWVP